MNPSLGWEKLSDVYYRNRPLCTWDWSHASDLNYSFSLTFCALHHDQKIHCYNYVGELQWSIDCSGLPSEIVNFEFAKNETFILVLEDRIRRYTGWYPLQWEDTMLPDSVSDLIWDYKSGVALLQSSQDIYYYHDSRLELIYQNDDRFTLSTKHHWHTNGGLVVLLDTRVVLHLDIPTRKLSHAVAGSWQEVRISPKGFVCLYSMRENSIAIYKDPSRFLLEHSLDVIPDALEWCGSDTIAYCNYKNEEVKLIGPNGSYVAFWFPNPIIALRTEVDGVKVLTSASINFISKVENYTARIFSIGSTESSAILLDSLELLSNHAPRAIENLKVINLEQAVLECTQAARDEFAPYWQKRLLSAASFGKDSLSNAEFNSQAFVQTCDLLRVLNMLSQMGLPLTAKQFDDITIDGVLEILMRLHKFHKCIQICSFLNYEKKLGNVFKEWAVAKIKLSPDVDDSALYQSIITQMTNQGLVPGTSLIQIARAAFLEGRFHLAKKLAVESPLPRSKLQLLLDMDENELALSEAVKLLDPELTLTLLLLLRSRLTNAQFTKVLVLVLKDNTLLQFYERNNMVFLYDFYRQTDRYQELAMLIFNDGKKRNALLSFLPQVQNLYGIIDTPLAKENKELISRHISLVKHQQNLTSLLNYDFTDLTLDATLTQLIEMGQERHTSTLVKTFKISERKYYRIKCRTLVKAGRFDELNKFAKERKSPIGYKPFYEAVFNHGNPREAAVYVSMITGISNYEKIELYLKCGSFYDAIQLASREKDIALLQRIKEQLPDNQPQLMVVLKESIAKL
ncbi:AGL252Wp [Eremothecium gossypii ATCC 10895]|uniref:Probable vacuolar protein sorting-associated protein 16 homolog n=1 Tax=Eremothecium gossypii (strain ATCC 10895 / CBS 109.51 / FGSC 9923 / NRRL Y-1056) TaxID=284811 RepID=Q751F8_EREGS|nr:AGL252Wp [Eremothecium gossypii ATCC 10895]AAS54239.1 AGL252Wp [Eremothecium gossypii ATCC 10895]